MNHLFVSANVALILKKLNFDEPCIAFYDYAAPDAKIKTQPLLTAFTQKWGSQVTGINSKSGLILSNTETLAPLKQQVLEWLDINYGLLVNIAPWYDKEYIIKIYTNHGTEIYTGLVPYKTYEIALDKALEFALTTGIRKVLNHNAI